MIAYRLFLLALAFIPATNAYCVSLGFDDLDVEPMTEEHVPAAEAEASLLVEGALQLCGLAIPSLPTTGWELPSQNRKLTAEEFEEEMADVTGRSLQSAECLDPDHPCQSTNPPSWCYTFCGEYCTYCRQRLRHLNHSPTSADQSCVCSNIQTALSTTALTGILNGATLSYCKILD